MRRNELEVRRRAAFGNSLGDKGVQFRGGGIVPPSLILQLFLLCLICTVLLVELVQFPCDCCILCGIAGLEEFLQFFC